MYRPRFERPVMCAVDASEAGLAVACAGARLATSMRVPLVLLHVARASRRPYLLDRLLHRDRQARDPAEGRALLRNHAARLPFAAELKLASGAPADEIAVAVEEIDPALLVLGTRGRGVLDALHRHLASDVASRTARPVMIVPQDTEAAPLQGPVLCGVDDSPRTQRAALVAAGIAAALGSELIVCSVLDVTRAAAFGAPTAMPVVPEPTELSEYRTRAVRRRAEEIAEDVESLVPTRTVIGIGHPATQLRAAANDFDASMIAVAGTHRSPLGALLSGSSSAALVASADRPVLLVS